MLQLAIRQILAGFDDDAMRPIDDEIDRHVQDRSRRRDEFAESIADPGSSTDDVFAGSQQSSYFGSANFGSQYPG